MVPASALDPLTFLNIVVFDVLFYASLQFFQAFTVVEIRNLQAVTIAEQMEMAVVKAWQQGLSCQIDDFGLSRTGEDFFVAAHTAYDTVFYGCRFKSAFCLIHGITVGVDKNSLHVSLSSSVTERLHSAD